ncbi:pyridoxal phosphate-dependent aminotransferase [Streptomyces mobaraensis NBRC 13819 = DSM 40847]|uniref:Pyridoxal phosphate-dependent aminotransferase n=2 Tax=Streptomyces mobaraensis TaxID=35621 RepID=A0A5N5W9H4_STRMB|nr:pyridoxal phosphate-dependent aminotransferase [Streptomyces mobaraensis]EMF01228.1 class I and II aminotransferase [Streptomyces mobaraensis NBRC 13819 = DSM 40847]KAB7846941.1 pyridoxal phosphate-dependent aminotransferase [Streptomyces mobaraensis]QTT76626.1 pyridoxal phosphate-dependent aminotransferase [Streptomyces mobaraensis NBRC 13819 = DSM 40847]
MITPCRRWHELSLIERQARAAQGSGDPTWDLAEALLHGLPTSAGRVGFRAGNYPDPRGEPELRRRIAARENAKYGLSVDEDHIVVTHGATEALFLLAHTFLDPGDRVAVQAPSVLFYRDILENLGAVVVPLDAEPDGAAPARMRWVHSPSNPDGLVLADGAMAGHAEAAGADDALLLVDQVYDELIVGGERPRENQALLDAGHVAKVNSVSKSFGCPGIRVGWITTAPAVARMLTGVAERLRMGPSLVAQRAAAALLEQPLDGNLPMLAERRAVAVRALSLLDVFEPAAPPAGGLCFWLKLTDPTAGARRFCDRTLAETGVRLMPGPGFWRGTDDRVRLAFGAAPEYLDAAFGRLHRLADSGATGAGGRGIRSRPDRSLRQVSR